MRVDLYELLRERSLQHPTRLTELSVAGKELRLSVRGYPWWREEKQSAAEAEVMFIFKGVTLGSFDLFSVLNPDDDEFLEEFDVSLLAEHDWAQPSIFQIYCSGPLPDPLALYARLEDYLRQANAYKNARDFLNIDRGLLKRFSEITASDSYLVARAPDRIRQIVCDELQRQAVSYNVVSVKDWCDGHLLVRLGSSSFVCEEAFAEFS